MLKKPEFLRLFPAAACPAAKPKDPAATCAQRSHLRSQLELLYRYLLPTQLLVQSYSCA